MKTIVYATDYSQNSVAALKYAHALCKQLQARLVVTHVYDVPTVLGTQLVGPFPDLQKDAQHHEHERLEEFYLEHLETNSTQMTLQIEPIENMSVISGIISKATEWHALMIIVGMRGESTVREIIMGSTPIKLIKKAPCAVLAIPADSSFTKIKTLVYATDFEEEDVHVIQKLSEMFKPFEPEIKVVHISTKKEYAGETQMTWFRDLLESKVSYPKLDFELLFSDDIFESLKAYLDEVSPEMVVMLERKKKGGIINWFQRNMVKKMESYGKIPVLSFNEANHQTFYF